MNCHAPPLRTCWSAFALCLAALLVPCTGAATPGEVPVGARLQRLELRGLNGPSASLKAYAGKPLLINLWASWCGPCREEMGSLDRLDQKEKSRRFAIIGISTDTREGAARAYLGDARSTLHHYIDANLKAENMFGADRLPLTVLVDGKGKVLAKHYGAWDWDQPLAQRWIGDALRR